MNPPIREKIHHDAIWSAVENGTVDLIGSDHAPHLKKDKMKKYPNSPSGMPGVQTLVPLLLDHYNNGRISLEKIVNLTSYNAHKIFGIRNKGILKEGFDADFTIVDINSERIIDNRWIASKCGWSPFHGKKIKGWPVGTIVRGNIVAWKDKIQGSPVGKELNFKK
jgi:dihydroorotase